MLDGAQEPLVGRGERGLGAKVEGWQARFDGAEEGAVQEGGVREGGTVQEGEQVRKKPKLELGWRQEHQNSRNWRENEQQQLQRLGSKDEEEWKQQVNRQLQEHITQSPLKALTGPPPENSPSPVKPHEGQHSDSHMMSPGPLSQGRTMAHRLVSPIRGGSTLAPKADSFVALRTHGFVGAHIQPVTAEPVQRGYGQGEGVKSADEVSEAEAAAAAAAAAEAARAAESVRFFHSLNRIRSQLDSIGTGARAEAGAGAGEGAGEGAGAEAGVGAGAAAGAAARAAAGAAAGTNSLPPFSLMSPEQRREDVGRLLRFETAPNFPSVAHDELTHREQQQQQQRRGDESPLAQMDLMLTASWHRQHGGRPLAADAVLEQRIQADSVGGDAIVLEQSTPGHRILGQPIRGGAMVAGTIGVDSIAEHHIPGRPIRSDALEGRPPIR
ncbi:unnamed protein product, partial [Closterium sp. NIES-54]